MAAHFSQRPHLNRVLIVIIQKYVTEADFLIAKAAHGEGFLDVQERCLSWNFVVGQRRAVLTNDQGLSVEMDEVDLSTAFIASQEMLELRSSKFRCETFLQYQAFFDAFPSLQTFKVTFLSKVSLPPLPVPGDLAAMMRKDTAADPLPLGNMAIA